MSDVFDCSIHYNRSCAPWLDIVSLNQLMQNMACQGVSRENILRKYNAAFVSCGCRPSSFPLREEQKLKIHEGKSGEKDT
jgi:hypothetical protein